MYDQDLLKRVGKVTSQIDEVQFKSFIDTILSAGRIYICGAGRSGLVAKAFAMRLIHLDKNVFVVGETVTPALRAGDTLIAVSGSGSTKSVMEIVNISHKLGARIIAVTGDAASPIAQKATLTVVIPTKKMVPDITSYEVRELAGGPNVTPLGSLFELSTLVFLESAVVALMDKLKVDESQMRLKHANLE